MTMKVLPLIAAVALLLSGVHVTLPVGAWPVTMPLPVVALVAELGVCAALGWLIARTIGWRPLLWRTA